MSPVPASVSTRCRVMRAKSKAAVATSMADCATRTASVPAAAWAAASRSAACRSSTSRRNGTGSMVTSLSPRLTVWLSLTWTATMRPETCGATDTKSDRT